MNTYHHFIFRYFHSRECFSGQKAPSFIDYFAICSLISHLDAEVPLWLIWLCHQPNLWNFNVRQVFQFAYWTRKCSFNEGRWIVICEMHLYSIEAWSVKLSDRKRPKTNRKRLCWSDFFQVLFSRPFEVLAFWLLKYVLLLNEWKFNQFWQRRTSELGPQRIPMFDAIISSYMWKNL